MSDSHADKFHSEYPGPVILHIGRKRMYLLLIGSVLFVATGIVMVLKGEESGWLPACFFGLTAIVGAVSLLPEATTLRLDADGMETTTLFRKTHYRWRDVSDFRAASPLPLLWPTAYRYVCFNLSTLSGPGTKLAVAFTGRTSMLPDTYGLSAEALALLLNNWRNTASIETIAQSSPVAHPES